MSEDREPLTSEIAVLSQDPEQKNGDKPKPNGDIKGKGKDETKDEPEIVRSIPHVGPSPGL